jgi:hypothetical protein
MSLGLDRLSAPNTTIEKIVNDAFNRIEDEPKLGAPLKKEKQIPPT